MNPVINHNFDSKINLRIEEILDCIKIGIVTINEDYCINKLNMYFIKMFGYKKDKLLGKSIDILFNTDEYKYLQQYIMNHVNSNNNSTIHKIKLNGFRKDKVIIPLEITLIINNDNQNHMCIIIMRDISEFQQTVDDLEYLAYYDQLTKIPNRTLFRDRAETAIRIAQREEENLAVVYIDIDNFKTINDKMGHEAGDRLLEDLSRRLQKCVRESDTLSRVGGDEFAILILKIACVEDASTLEERILKSNQIPIKINDHNIIPKISLGISIFPQDGNNIDELLKNADIAMYSAKNNGKNQYVFYKPHMIQETK